MNNKFAVEDKHTEEFIQDIEKTIKLQKYNSPAKTPEEIHSERILKIMQLENISTINDFCTDFKVSSKTFSAAKNGESFLPLKCALKIEKELGCSLDWLYGLSDIMEDKDKAFFIDMRKCLKIETKKKLFFNGEKFIAKKCNYLVIDLNYNQLMLLKSIERIRQLNKTQTLSYTECEKLLQTIEQEFKDKQYIEIPMSFKIPLNITL